MWIFQNFSGDSLKNTLKTGCSQNLNPTITTGTSFEQSKDFPKANSADFPKANSEGWGFGPRGTDRQHCNRLLHTEAASARVVKLLYCQTCHRVILYFYFQTSEMQWREEKCSHVQMSTQQYVGDQAQCMTKFHASLNCK